MTFAKAVNQEMRNTFGSRWISTAVTTGISLTLAIVVLSMMYTGMQDMMEQITVGLEEAGKGLSK